MIQANEHQNLLHTPVHHRFIEAMSTTAQTMMKKNEIPIMETSILILPGKRVPRCKELSNNYFSLMTYSE